MAPKKVTPRGRAASPPEAPLPAPKPKKKTAAKKRQTRAKPTSTTRYIRAIYSPAGGTRITLSDDRRIQLAPRGQVGDIAIVSEEDREDVLYQRNFGHTFEEISAAEAKDILSKQNTNQQAPREFGIMDELRNAKGEPYAQAKPTIEIPFEQQGQVVAHISDAPAGRFTDGHQERIERAPGAAPQQVAVPGSVQNPTGGQMPAGLSEAQAAEYLGLPREQRADWLARLRGNTEAGQAVAAEAYTQSLRVNVAPTQREQ